jgi:hypothetical protein
MNIQGFTSVRAVAAELNRARHSHAAWWRVASNVNGSFAVACAGVTATETASAKKALAQRVPYRRAFGTK